MNDIAEQAQLLDQPGGERLRLRFNGPFEGDEVTWDAAFYTLHHWRQIHPQEATQQNFIDIGEEGGNGIALIVVLNVPQIDLPTVRKTMMMIRQYKRLSHGRHYYGPKLRG